MVPLALRRSDIGFGRVVVDDTGVTRHGLVSSQSIAWGDILDYRLTIEMRGSRIEVLYLVDHLNLVLIASDVLRGYRGAHRFRFGIRMLGATGELAFNWRFRGVAIAIAQIVRRVDPLLSRQARAAFAATGVGRFGPLALGDRGIRWADRPLLPRDDVESVELFNSSPVQLRVMARRKAWPYGRAPLAEIPNLAAALRLARALGYPVRGTELVAPLAIG
ncbi:MAG TPA: hypothetical protein VFT22_35340 [Kofleriaceae bacterium]|nr:hypothetical protein [Kofleriaceae bacterium]